MTRDFHMNPMDITIISASGAPIVTDVFADSFAITPSILRKAGSKFSAKMSVPIKDIAGYFNAATTDGPIPRLDWAISFSGYSSRNFPLLCFYSLSGDNRYTIFLDNLTDDFTCDAKMNQRECTYDITWTFAITTPSKSINLHIDTKQGPWTAAITRAVKVLRPQGMPRFPNASWLPVYCTWYAVHACLSGEYLDANAKLAAELGCGTFIVDDGWCYDEMKRVSPETIGPWYDDIGDWEISEKKLPDFKAHVAYAQSLGLKYLLWVAPYFCFKNSKFFKGLPEKDRGIASLWGTFIYLLENEAISKAVRKRLLKVVRDLDLDGLKIDFLDVMYGNVDKPIGHHSLKFIKELTAAIRKQAGDEALIEFRQSYATPQMLDFATQFRAGDVPFDYLRNLARLSAIRVLLGDGVPIHADPLYWSQDELDVTVARHMITSLSAVPMISMDLPKLTKKHKAIVSHYLGFYKEHLATFSRGHWRVEYTGSIPSFISVTRGKERIIILVDYCHLPEAIESFKGNTHILNMSPKAVVAKVAFDMYGNENTTGTIAPGGRGTL